MANLCSIPMDFLVMRGQGIKLTSYIAKKCREKNTLLPVLEKGDMDEGYEGATVLEPKCNLYLDDPVACLDYSSLYPSAMMSENISHDSKVLTREYDLNGKLIKELGTKDETGRFIYDNLPTYTYVDIQYDTYKWQRKGGNSKAAMEKVKVGYKICRFAQFPEEKGRAIMPSILEELLAARKTTRKLIEKEKDEFMKNILDKRQLSIKVTANSMYGQTGAKTSTFYEKDCAASTTAIGRKLLTYAKRVVEEAYLNQVVPTKNHGDVRTNAEYVYGDTDSVFFKFNLTDVTTGEKILGQKALEITIELAKQAGELASMFLKNPHDLEYEKTFMPFCLLSKKRYVGMMYEDDHHKCKRKSMGIVLKRRDNAPIVKDIYGGIIDILMKEKNIEHAIKFLRECLQQIVDGKCAMDKLVITKSLRSGYKILSNSRIKSWRTEWANAIRAINRATETGFPMCILRTPTGKRYRANGLRRRNLFLKIN
jgi:DNA polymerase delta subunit 1